MEDLMVAKTHQKRFVMKLSLFAQATNRLSNLASHAKELLNNLVAFAERLSPHSPKAIESSL